MTPNRQKGQKQNLQQTHRGMAPERGGHPAAGYDKALTDPAAFAGKRTQMTQQRPVQKTVYNMPHWGEDAGCPPTERPSDSNDLNTCDVTQTVSGSRSPADSPPNPLR